MNKRVEHELHRDLMVGHILFDDRLFPVRLLREHRPGDADTLGAALYDNGLRVHIEKLIFQRRAPRIHDKYFHCILSPSFSFPPPAAR